MIQRWARWSNNATPLPAVPTQFGSPFCTHGVSPAGSGENIGFNGGLSKAWEAVSIHSRYCLVPTAPLGSTTRNVAILPGVDASIPSKDLTVTWETAKLDNKIGSRNERRENFMRKLLLRLATKGVEGKRLGLLAEAQTSHDLICAAWEAEGCDDRAPAFQRARLVIRPCIPESAIVHRVHGHAGVRAPVLIRGLLSATTDHQADFR